MTEWRPVVGYESRYEVSDDGQVASLPWKHRRWRIVLKPWTGKPGYPTVSLNDGDRRRNRYIHSLVAAAFLGPRPDGMQVRHMDGDQTNSHVSNLQYGTPSQNMHDKRSHGTNAMLNRTHCPHGHPYDEANTLRSNGRRYCRACMQDYKRRTRGKAA